MFVLFLHISDNYFNLKNEEQMAAELYKIYFQQLKYIIWMQL